MSVDLHLTVNSEPLELGGPVRPDNLGRAGLGKIPVWRRWLSRLPRGFGYWQAADPLVSCFGGEVDIYACRQDYLDEDRRWRTHCLVRSRGNRIVGVEIRIIEGVYAAGNLFDRFVDAGCDLVGEPDRRDDGFAEWRRDGLLIDAELAADLRNARFRLEI